MERMPRRGNVETAQDDPFARLPADVFLSILSGIDDLKSLCRCSLVSKRFASCIYGVKSVSHILPDFTMHPEDDEDIYELLPMMLACSNEKIGRLLDVASLPELKFSLFLKNFKEIKSVSLEFQSPTIFCNPGFLKWSSKCRRTTVDGLISLVVDSVCKRTASQLVNQAGGVEISDLFPVDRVKCNLFFPLHSCKDWIFVLCMLIKLHPSLEYISLSNMDQEVTLVLKDEELVKWRNHILAGTLLTQSYPQPIPTGWVPDFHLQLSDYVLKCVCFVILRLPCDPNDVEDEGVIQCDYDVEDELHAQAKKAILENHTDVLEYMCFNPSPATDYYQRNPGPRAFAWQP